jgi:DNA-binding MarR family transcriptional regulator
MDTFTSDTDDCFAVRQAARHLSKLYERHLSKVGMTPTQFSLLNTLSRHPRSTMIELANTLVMDRTTLVRVLKPLLRDGLVATYAEGQGDRRLRLMLTERGREKISEATVYWRAAQASFESTFGHDEAAHLRSELFRVTRDASDR